jgi:hypothetical protein
MDHKEKQITNSLSRPRGRMMDFAPRNVATTAKKPTSVADKEVHRHELAMREYARREEIARQIERQKEEELLKKRRIAAAKQDLARRVEAERKRVEAEHKRIMAERHARIAREQLERRRRAKLVPKEISSKKVADLDESFDISETEYKKPQAMPKMAQAAPKRPQIVSRKPAAAPRPAVKAPVKPTIESDDSFDDLIDETIDEPTNEVKSDTLDDNLFDDIDEIEKEVEAEDTSKNNARYVLGGHFPFINAEVEKRPLSGGEKTVEQTKARGRYVPYNEPISHKNIYARTLAKEKRGRDVPTMVKSGSENSPKISLAIAIILTVILGAAVGAIAYLALFQ